MGVRLAGLVALVLVAVTYGPGVIQGRVLVPGDMLEAFAPWTEPGVSRPPVNGLLGDQVQQMYPWRLFIHREIAEGRFPLWNPHGGGGAPLFANGQSAVLFPLNLATLWLTPEVAATVVQLAKPPLAAIGAALFVRALGVGAMGCAVAGIAWAFSGPMVTWLGWPHTNALLMVPYLFWTATRWLQSGAFRWWVGHAACVGVQLLGGHPETSAHTALALGIYGAIWLLPDVRRSPLLAIGRWVGWAASVGMGGALAGAQVVPLLAAIADSGTLAERSARSLAGVLLERETALTWVVPNFFGTPLADTFGPLNFLNYNETLGYVGLGTLALAAVSGFFPLRRGWAALAGVTLMALGLIYGLPLVSELRHLPGLTHAANTRFVFLAAFGLACLAGLGADAAFRGPRWYGAVAASLCAGAGLVALVLALSPDRILPPPDAISRLSTLEAALVRQEGLWRASGLAGLWAGTLALAAIAVRAGPMAAAPSRSPATVWRPSPGAGVKTGRPNGSGSQPPGPMAAAPSRPAGSQQLLAAHLQPFGDPALAQESRRAGPMAAAPSRSALAAGVPLLVAGVLALDLFLFGRLYNPMVPPELLHRVPESIAFVQREDPGARVLGLGEALLPNTAILFGLNDLRLYEPVAHRRVAFFFERLDPIVGQDIRSRFYLFVWQPDPAWLRLAGVRWVLAPLADGRVPSTDSLAAAGLVPRYQDRTTAVLENPGALPRAFLVQGAIEVPDEYAALAGLAGAECGVRRLACVIIETEQGAGQQQAGGGAILADDRAAAQPQSVDATFTPGRIQLRVDSPRGGWVIVNDAFYPGWIAWVEGKMAPIHHANYLFMGVRVPAGEHLVTMEYRPLSVRVGAALSAVALLALAVLAFALRRGSHHLRKRKGEEPVPSPLAGEGEGGGLVG